MTDSSGSLYGSRRRIGRTKLPWKRPVTVSFCVSPSDKGHSLEAFREYNPAANIHRIAPTPLLLTVAENNICPMDLTLETYSQAPEPKKLHHFPADHFDAYSEGNYDSNVEVQAKFIGKYLLK
jgi:hypothetical protein